MTGMFFLAAALSANCVDPRVRTYVEPVRIVWQSPKAEGFGERFKVADPEILLGIRPAEAGCRSVEVNPFLGDLEWAEGSMALPNGGSVRVRAAKRGDGGLDVDVQAPEGVRIVGR